MVRNSDDQAQKSLQTLTRSSFFLVFKLANPWDVVTGCDLSSVAGGTATGPQ